MGDEVPADRVSTSIDAFGDQFVTQLDTDGIPDGCRSLQLGSEAHDRGAKLAVCESALSVYDRDARHVRPREQESLVFITRLIPYSP